MNGNKQFTPNEQTLISLNQIITNQRGEMTVKKIYKKIEMEEMMKILQEKRKDIISGTSQQIQNKQQSNKSNKSETKERKEIQITNEKESKQTNCGIPFFWIKILYSLGIFMTYSQSEEDIICLSYLNDIRYRTLPPAFNSETQTIKMKKELTFCFDENVYIKNKELTVVLSYKSNECGDVIENTGRLIPKTKIQWGVDLIEINPNSLFNIFLPNNDHEIEDFIVIESTFHNFDKKVMNYFYEF